LNKIVLVLIALTAISGVGVLANNMFIIDLQPYQIFNSFDQFTDPICTCLGDDGLYSQENCQGFANGFSDPNQLCTAVAGLDEYGRPPAILSAQGCGVGFWKNNLDSNRDSNLAGIESENTLIWPEGYQPNYYFNDMFHTTISPSENDLNVEITKAAKDENGKNKDEKDDAKDNDDILREESENEEDEKVARDEHDKNKDEKDDAKDNDDILREESENEEHEKVARDEHDKNKAEKDDAKDNDDILREESENEDVVIGDAKDRGPTLVEALNARGGDMNSLLRQSVTAMLNAAHPEINYPYSVVQVIELTQISIINEDYQKTIDMFEKYNDELEKPPMCLE